MNDVIINREHYSISGFNDNNEFPYVNELASLSEAVEIAKAYPGKYKDGYATHINRTVSVRCGEHALTGQTHEYGVSHDGQLTVLRTVRTDEDLVDSLKNQIERLNAELSDEERALYFSQIKEAANQILVISRVSRPAGFRLIYFSDNDRYQECLKRLICSVITSQSCCDPEILEYKFAQELEEEAQLLSDMISTPVIPRENHQAWSVVS